MITDIVELQHRLQEARNEGKGKGRTMPAPVPTPKHSYRMLNAAVKHDINELFQSGLTPDRVSEVLQIRLSMVESEKEKIEQYNEGRRKYFLNHELPGQMAYFSILQR